MHLLPNIHHTNLYDENIEAKRATTYDLISEDGEYQ